MKPSLTTIQKIQALPWLYAFGAGTNIFAVLTVFGPVFPLYMDSLGMPKTRIGLMLALIPFAGLVALFLSRWVMKVGVKRVLISFYGLRTLFVSWVIFAPWLLARYGLNVTFAVVFFIVLAFALCRAVAETGYFPWAQEFIPNAIRGKTDAMSSIISGIACVAASLAAALVMKQTSGFTGYILLTLIGAMFALVALGAAARIPGGAPAPKLPQPSTFVSDLLAPFWDRNFRIYLAGIGCWAFGIGMLAFCPLFLKDSIGIGSAWVLVLDAVFRAGLLSSSYLWGWSADRFGSKPVLLTSVILTLLFPVLLMFLPRGFTWTFGLTVAIYAVLGIGVQCYIAGAGRYLFVSAVPAEKSNSNYYSIWYATLGVCSGFSPMFAGWLLDACRPLRLDWHFMQVDAFTPVFLLCALMLGVALWIFSSLRSDSAMRTGEFLSMFMQGNPVMAFGSMIRYRLAKDEGDRILTTEQMGKAMNPLSVNEMLEALADPSFNVRYEAVVSLARMPAHGAVLRALIEVLRHKEPDLSEAAGWALGRIGDRRAIPALQEMLQSEYALLRARCARSLANLGDHASVPVILAGLKNEPHDGIRVAYAAALGVFRATEALDDLLALLRRLTEESLRGEVALAIARMMNGESHFIRLWRDSRADMGTACATGLMAMRRRVPHPLPANLAALESAVYQAEQALASHDLKTGGVLLARIIQALMAAPAEAVVQKILRECGGRLEGAAAPRHEYIFLAITGLHWLWRRHQPKENK